MIHLCNQPLIIYDTVHRLPLEVVHDEYTEYKMADYRALVSTWERYSKAKFRTPHHIKWGVFCAIYAIAIVLCCVVL